MPLSNSTLAAIQRAGAAAFIAEEKLQEEVKAYADRVNAAITENAYSPDNDTLIENWKVAARLQHTLMGIEDELRKVYQIAAQLTAYNEPVAQDMPALVAPADAAGKRTGKRVGATPDVAVKPRKPRKGATAPKSKAGKVAASPPSSTALGANPTRLLAYFDRTLNANDFSAVNLTTTARETGLPLGSMSAAVKKLLQTGRILPGPRGSLKLSASGSSSSVSPSESQPALQA